VQEKHEQGTIQSYYDVAGVNELLKGTRFEIAQLNQMEQQVQGLI